MHVLAVIVLSEINKDIKNFVCQIDLRFMFQFNNRDDFDFDIVYFPFLDGDVSRRTSYGVYISQLITFAWASWNLSDFNCRNKALNAKRLR